MSTGAIKYLGKGSLEIATPLRKETPPLPIMRNCLLTPSHIYDELLTVKYPPWMLSM